MIVGDTVKEAIGNVVSGDITIASNGEALTQLAVKGRMTGRLNAGGTLDSDYEDWTLNVCVRTK